MAISFECTDCGKRLKADDRMAGRRIKCPACQAVLEVAIPERDDFDLPVEEEANSSGEASDDPFRGVSSDNLEDARARKDRIAARQAQRDIERAREEEKQLKATKKKKSKLSSKSDGSLDPDVGQPFKFHWIFLLALFPLTLSVVWPGSSAVDRLKRSLAEHPEVESDVNEAMSLSEVLMSFPEHRIEGALFPRDTLMHWVLGVISAAAYLGLLFCMFPGTVNRTRRLLLVGIFTGTIGILLLLAFQFVAGISHGLRLRGGGVGILIILVIQLIGYSYRCAEDPTIGFWGSFFGFTVGVGFCEELCKSLPIRHYLRTHRKTGWRGACLTGLASGIGFGVSEGIMYSSGMYNGLHGGLIYLVRFASCVSLHAMWSGSVALMMYQNQDFLDADGWTEILVGLLYYVSISMILHGLYDSLLKHDLHWLALLIGIGSYVWLFYLVRESRGT